MTLRSYSNYIMNFYGGYLFLFCSCFSMTIFMFSKMGADFIIGNWALQPDQLSNFWYYCGFSFAFAFAQGISVFWRAAAFFLFGLAASKKLHEEMIKKVMAAPVNLYFDTTPIGRILNKFSKDLNNIESTLCHLYSGISFFIFMLMYTMIIAVYALPMVLLALPIIVCLSWRLLRKAKRAIKETTRIQSTTKSPLISYMEETISGSSTIRAFGKVDQFVEGNKRFLNKNILAE